MTVRAIQRVAYYNGAYVPEADVRVPFRDRSFLYGDAGFDLTRTFNGRAFKVREHMARLYRSLAYLDIDPGLSPAEMTAITEEVLARNLHLRAEGEDAGGLRAHRVLASRSQGRLYFSYAGGTIFPPPPLRECRAPGK